MAFAIVASFVVAFLITVPFAYTPLPRLDAWIPAFTSAVVVTDLITSALLFSQFSIARRRALLVLAAGYLFSALIVVPYALTFPGVFAPTGLLGADLQSAVWLYIIWHMASPLSVIVYELFKNANDRTAPLSREPLGTPISLNVAIVIAIVCALTSPGRPSGSVRPVTRGRLPWTRWQHPLRMRSTSRWARLRSTPRLRCNTLHVRHPMTLRCEPLWRTSPLPAPVGARPSQACGQ